MPDLIAFLRARLDEDYETASMGQWLSGGVEAGPATTNGMQPGLNGVLVIDPARVLAEVEAKRAILDLINSPGPMALRLLAVPYADHPDYREEWRP